MPDRLSHHPDPSRIERLPSLTDVPYMKRLFARIDIEVDAQRRATARNCTGCSD
jgi:hypothetical protein